MGKFTSQVKSFTKAAEGEMLKNFRSMCREVCKRIIMRTPVDEGWARGSWSPSVGSPVRPQKIADPTGEITTAKVDAVLATLKLGQKFYLVSYLPYIKVLEFGLYPNPPKGGSGKTINGFSTQAPAGMFRITLAEVPTIMKSSR